MGSSTYSHDDKAARDAFKAARSIPTFAYHAAVASGRASGVHPSLSPRGVALRESRDSTEHPISLPLGVIMDTSGSMRTVPKIIQSKLSKLMGTLLDDKASGKRYLGDAYPAILVGACDNYKGIGADGCLQVGQFESGIEIDNDVTNLWLTNNGGDAYHESYELPLYFFARHTAHDNWDKRGRKGYLFIIGDEDPFDTVSASEVRAVIDDGLEQDVPLATVIAEVQERYHVFFIIPNLSTNYNSTGLFTRWVERLGERVLKLDDPEKVCELIAATVALCEENVGIDDLDTDKVSDGISTALVPLASSVLAARSASGVARIDASTLPAVSGDAAEVERL